MGPAASQTQNYDLSDASDRGLRRMVTKSLATTFLRRHAGKFHYGGYERPVLFLTGKDLYFKYGISGGEDGRYTYHETGALDEFASATQRLNLGAESQNH
jgi:hypothetical protein